MDIIAHPGFILRASMLVLGIACYYDITKRYGWGIAGMVFLVLGGILMAST